MTVDEIEAAYARRLDAESAAERFIRERFARYNGGDMKLYFSVTPMFLRGEVLDPLSARNQALVSRPPRHPAIDDANFLENAPTYPSIHGVESVELLAEEGWEVWRTELHRSGYAELIHRTANYRGQNDDDKVIYPRWIALNLWRFLQMVAVAYADAGVAGPSLVTVGLANARGAYIFRDPIRNPGRQPYKLREDQVLLPPLQTADVGAGFPRLLKVLCDRFWHAFREQHCPFVSEEGELTGPL